MTGKGMTGKSGRKHRTLNNGRLPRVVIIGGGFAGLNAAKALRNEAVDVLLVDRNNFHKFQPLLYQVATAGLEPDEVARNLRDFFRGGRNIDAHLGTVRDIDLDNKRLHFLKGPDVEYDYLLVAPGAVTTYFGIEGAEDYAFPIKNLSDAIHLRNHILRQFERYDRDARSIGESALHFVVVGGGPTGVEIAGALTELFLVLQKDFPRLDTSRARVTLIEMLPGVLTNYHEDSQQYALKVLRERGVDVRLETAVEEVAEDHIRLKGGEIVETRTLIWAAGVASSPLVDLLKVEQGKGGRARVSEDLSHPDHPEVFILGDVCGEIGDERIEYPQLAPVAIQQGRHAAQQILNDLNGGPRETFVYKDRGQMATIGRNAAVAELASGKRMTGFVAWFLWVTVHIMQLIGFRNRANVLVNWMYNYLTYDRAARLILDIIAVPEELPEEVEDIDRRVQETLQDIGDERR